MTGFWRVGLVLAALLLLFALSLAGVLSKPLDRRGHERAARWLSRAARGARLLLGAAGVSLLYAALIEADWLEVTRLRVETPKLAAGERLELAVVSDLHVAHDTRALVALRDELTSRPVDLVVFTGDAINRREAVDLFRATLVSLGGRLGRAAVKGNHDAIRWRDVELFSGAATELMSDRPAVLGDRLALCGAPWGATELVEDCLAAAPADTVSIFVYHSPDLVEALRHRPDLYLAGHTHGGQVRLPFVGSLLSVSDFGRRYEAGRYEVNGTTLVVSRGIGFEPGFPALRFLCRPELIRVELVGTGAPR
ncbi:MAG: metallophosphoesterase [Myxococcota bacterium]